MINNTGDKITKVREFIKFFSAIAIRDFYESIFVIKYLVRTCKPIVIKKNEISTIRDTDIIG